MCGSVCVCGGEGGCLLFCCQRLIRTVHVAADTNPVVVDDCWLAEPDEEADGAADCEAPDDADDDDVDGNGAVAEPKPFGRIIMVAFFNV